MSNNISYSGEIMRKGIHLSSCIFAVLLFLLGRDQILIPMIVLTICFVLADYSRINNLWVNKLYYLIFNKITRSIEQDKLTGASFVLVGASLTILLFNEKAAITALLFLSIGDSLAALIGRKHGKTLIGNKTLEGSFACFISCALISIIITSIPLMVALFASLVATLLEGINFYKLNDNLTIPIGSAFVIDILNTII